MNLDPKIGRRRRGNVEGEDDKIRNLVKIKRKTEKNLVERKKSG